MAILPKRLGTQRDRSSSARELAVRKKLFPFGTDASAREIAPLFRGGVVSNVSPNENDGPDGGPINGVGRNPSTRWRSAASVNGAGRISEGVPATCLPVIVR